MVRRLRGGGGGVLLRKHKKCEGCGLKEASFGLPDGGKTVVRRRWCANCAKKQAGGVKGAQSGKRPRERESETKNKLVGHLKKLKEKLATMEKAVLKHKNEIATTNASIDNHTVRGTDRDCS